jgi:hypothetical protein
MYSSLAYSLSGERPDRSRFAINYSESTFRPAPSDLAIDQALEDFAALSLPKNPRPRRIPVDDGQYTSYRPLDSNQPPLPYASSYATNKTGTSTVSYQQQQPMKMIEYPRPGSKISTSYSRRQPVAKYQYADTSASQYTSPGPTAPSRHAGKSSKRRQESLYSEIGPEDSISQVSNSTRRSNRWAGGDEYDSQGRSAWRRGRTRRRESEYAGSEYGGQEYGGAAPVWYETREVTPWD